MAFVSINTLLFSLFKSTLFRRRGLEIIRVVVIVQIELFIKSPVNELNEQHLTFAVLISLFPLLVHVSCINAPLFQKRSRLKKLLLVNTLILAVIYFVESDKEFVVLTQILE